MKVKTTEEEAIQKCLELDPTSSLLTVYDQEEQHFLNKMLVEFSNISINTWIGMKFNGYEYDWVDGTDTNFTNWSEYAVKDGNEPCVQMSLISGMLGKWTDISCKKPALVVCQKRQEINFNSLKDVIKNLTKVLEKQKIEHDKKHKALQDEMKTFKASSLPIGFLYSQLPNQSSPLELWPNTNWIEVTQQYAGLFFRAEGGGSETFGQTQQANQSWISSIYSWGYSRLRTDGIQRDGVVELDQGKWHSCYPAYGLYKIGFYTTKAEVRPKNTAIKIWKRIQ